MAHKFAHIWSSFRGKFTASNPPTLVFTYDGKIDLSTITAGGVLARGTHKSGSLGDHYITGKTDELGDLKKLTLDWEDGGAELQGLLVRDRNNEMIIAGRCIIKNVKRVDGRKKVDQEEEPWIITKP